MDREVKKPAESAWRFALCAACRRPFATKGREKCRACTAPEDAAMEQIK